MKIEFFDDGSVLFKAESKDDAKAFSVEKLMKLATEMENKKYLFLLKQEELARKSGVFVE